jgi:hypothetical protein
MTTNDVRLFLEITTRQAELDECNRRIELHRTTTRLRLGESQPREPSRNRMGSGRRSGKYAVRYCRHSALGQGGCIDE